MAMNNPFYEEWRACLRSHYAFVLEERDEVTEPSLRGVLYDTGFTDAEILLLQQTVLGLATDASPLAPDPAADTLPNTLPDPLPALLPTTESVVPTDSVAEMIISTSSEVVQNHEIGIAADAADLNVVTEDNRQTVNEDEEHKEAPIADLGNGQQLSLF